MKRFWLLLLIAVGALHAETVIVPAPTLPGKPINAIGTGVQIDYPFRGFSDAMKDPAQFDALATAIRRLGVKTLRFPGGCAAYAYSTSGPDSLDAYKEIYYACDSTISTWADYRDFFRLCKATGTQAIYQVNIGNYYDPATREVFAIAPRDSGLIYGKPDAEQVLKRDTPQEANYDYSKLPAAVAEAVEVAKTAREMGVTVIWEFGNEDYCFYTPETYVRTIQPFSTALQAVDPEAQFAVCSDGISWGDWSWPQTVFKLAKERSLPIDYASFHLYVQGGGGGAYTNGAASYEAIIRSWHNIRNLHAGMQAALRENGFVDTRLAITEGNVTAAGEMIGQPFEHGLGRALGEAAIYPERISRYAFLIHHDLVRSGPWQGTWYCRIFYDPAKPMAERYTIPVAAEVSGRVAEHAQNQLLFDDGRGVTVSGALDGSGYLLTAGNPKAAAEPLTVEFPSPIAETVKLESLVCANLDTPEYEERATSLPTADHRLQVTLPAYSFNRIRVPKR